MLEQQPSGGARIQVLGQHAVDGGSEGGIRAVGGHVNSVAPLRYWPLTSLNRCGLGVKCWKHNGGAMDDDYDYVDELPPPPRIDIPQADRELLELAARAIGAKFKEVDGEGYGNLHFEDSPIVHSWNPLQFSGDAFELMVRCAFKVEIDPYNKTVLAMLDIAYVAENFGDDPQAAARRAIVRAAAGIGKTL